MADHPVAACDHRGCGRREISFDVHHERARRDDERPALMARRDEGGFVEVVPDQFELSRRLHENRRAKRRQRLRGSLALALLAVAALVAWSIMERL